MKLQELIGRPVRVKYTGWMDNIAAVDENNKITLKHLKDTNQRFDPSELELLVELPSE